MDKLLEVEMSNIEKLTKIKVPKDLNEQFSCLRTSKYWRNISKVETFPPVIRCITKIISKLRNSLANLPKDKQKEILNEIRKNTPFYYQMGNRNFIRISVDDKKVDNKKTITDPIRSCRITSLAMALHALGISAYDLVNTTNSNRLYYVDLKILMCIGNELAKNSCKLKKKDDKLYNNESDLLNERFPDFLQLLFIYDTFRILFQKNPSCSENFQKKIEKNKLIFGKGFELPGNVIKRICRYFGVKYEKRYDYNINTIKTEMNQGKEILLGWWNRPPDCSSHVVYLVGFDKNSKFIINDPGTWKGKHYSEDKYIKCQQQKSGLRYRYYEVLSR